MTLIRFIQKNRELFSVTSCSSLHFNHDLYDPESYIRTFTIENNRNTVDAACKSYYSFTELEIFVDSVTVPVDDLGAKVAFDVAKGLARSIRQTKDGSTSDYYNKKYLTRQANQMLKTQKMTQLLEPDNNKDVSFNRCQMYMMLDGWDNVK